MPWNHTRPDMQPQVVDWFKFMDLDCNWITLHEFISCPSTWWDHTGRFLFFGLLFAYSYQGFAAWFDPLLCADLTDWLCSPDCLVFLFWPFTPPCVWKNSRQSLGAGRNRRDPWAPGFLNWTPGLPVIFDTPSGVIIPLSWGYYCLVDSIRPQR